MSSLHTTVRQSKIFDARTSFQITRKSATFKKSAAGNTRFQPVNNINHGMQTKSANSAPIQFKINVTRHDDPSEEEADRIADEIMHSSGSVNHLHPTDPKINRKCKFCNEEENKKKEIVHRKPSNAANLERAKAVIEESIGDRNITPGAGSKLDFPTRTFMEYNLGFDFGNVRIHTDSKSANSAKLLNASAYTVGHDIIFANGQYSPQYPDGKRLLAHELVHVIQQSKYSNYGERSTQTVRPNRNKQNVIPSTEQAAQQFLVLSRLRGILAKHRTLQGDENLELTSSLREDMLVFMPEKDIAKIRFPAPSVDDVIDQIRRNEISLVQGPETISERTQRILAEGPISGTQTTTTTGSLPDWLSLYDKGVAGFHVTIPSGSEPPLEARLAAPLRERGVILDSKVLLNLLANYNLGVQELEQLIRVLPPELRSYAPSIARWLAEKLQTTSLEASLKHERPPTATSSSEQLEKRELIPALEGKMKGQPSNIGSLKNVIKEIPYGVSVTVRF